MIYALLTSHARRLARDYNAKVNGLMHCHVRGVASIMLHDEPGNRIRLFFATNRHELYRNDIPLDDDMNLAIHPHHCDITLVKAFGHIRNYRFTAMPNQPTRFGGFSKCRYDSAINSGCGGLFDTGEKYSLMPSHASILTIFGESMDADELHTIYVPKDMQAAWLVIEGAEDPRYENVCYTKNPTFNQDGMYQKMTREEVVAALEFVARYVQE